MGNSFCSNRDLRHWYLEVRGCHNKIGGIGLGTKTSREWKDGEEVVRAGVKAVKRWSLEAGEGETFMRWCNN